jgi:hypothetical protein
MRCATLANPFEPIPKTAAPVPVGTGLSSRSTPVCAICSSDDVICHATIQWSNEAQEWQLAATFEQPAYCNNCSANCTLVWHILNYFGANATSSQNLDVPCDALR